MIQSQQHSLSDPELETLKEWLVAPGSVIFLKVIHGEQAFIQASVGESAMIKDKEKADYLADRAWELDFILRKFTAMLSEKPPYQFKTTTLTP